MPKKALDPKRALFVQEYLIDLNATQAAIRAGYSKKCASEQGYDLLRKPQIQKAIAEAMKKRADRLEVSQDRIVRELARVGFLDPAELLEGDGSVKLIKNMSEDARRVIAGMEVSEIFDNAAGDQKQALGLAKKIKLCDKLKALELLGRHLKMFDETVKVPGLEKALYEISEKFLPKVVNRGHEK
jgi:phage terminase small subunit